MGVEIAPADERLIVALDVDTEAQAMRLLDVLGAQVSFYKIGWRLFIGAGWSSVRQVLNRGKKVFLDLKIGDIDETVRAALHNMPPEANDIELLTIHGDDQTVGAARAGRKGLKPNLLMVMSLSSSAHDLKDTVAKAKLALDAGCDGLIASGSSVKELRKRFRHKDFLLVSAGIRPVGYPRDEHKLTLTPYEAITNGADYVVVGRPITLASSPRSAAESVIAEIEQAAK